MSNVKKVEILGRLPFHVSDNLTEKTKILEFIGQCQIPSFGLKCVFDTECTCVPNQYGGHTATYCFKISGQEAIPTIFILDMVHILDKNSSNYGTFGAEVIDVEANEIVIRMASNKLLGATLD